MNTNQETSDLQVLLDVAIEIGLRFLRELGDLDPIILAVANDVTFGMAIPLGNEADKLSMVEMMPLIFREKRVQRYAFIYTAWSSMRLDLRPSEDRNKQEVFAVMVQDGQSHISTSAEIFRNDDGSLADVGQIEKGQIQDVAMSGRMAAFVQAAEQIPRETMREFRRS